MRWLRAAHSFEDRNHCLESGAVLGVSLGFLFGFGGWHGDTDVGKGANRANACNGGKVSGVAGLVSDISLEIAGMMNQGL